MEKSGCNERYIYTVKEIWECWILVIEGYTSFLLFPQALVNLQVKERNLIIRVELWLKP